MQSKIEIKVAGLMVNYCSILQSYNLCKNLIDSGVVDLMVILDNSPFDTKKYDIDFGEKIKVLEGDNKGGYSYGNNIALRYLQQSYNLKTVLIMNPDVIIEKETFIECLKLFENQNEFKVLVPEMLDYYRKKDINYWDKVTYGKCLCECSYLLNFKKRSNVKHFSPSNIDNVYTADVLRGTFMICDFDALCDIDFFDDTTFLYWEEDKLFARLNQKGYKSGVILNKYFIHDHDIKSKKNINLKKKNKTQTLYWNSMYSYCRDYLNINILKKIILKAFIIYGYIEKNIIWTLIKIKQLIKK